jgi:CheY-like chemotaxis protein/anti-sigma regulatory factor (Ser/Thr protein kinase)
VNADRVRLEQVLLNLLTNAVRYTHNGGTISVEARSNGDMVEIAVSDTGIGVDSEQLERIFEPFVQVGDEGAGGLGIGLSLVRQLMHLHGGSVVAKSPGLGLGTTLQITLRRQKSARSTPPRPTPHSFAVSDTQPAMRVLIVDDNQDAAEMLSLMLERLGHPVRSVDCGRDVMNAVSEFGPDLVLLDLGLPDISGYEVAQQLRKAGHCNLSIIALTGFSHESARARTLDAGFDAHLIKPVSLEQVFAAVRKDALRAHPTPS